MDYLFFFKKIHVANMLVLVICIDNVPTLLIRMKSENLDFFEMETSEENNFECEISQRCIRNTAV